MVKNIITERLKFNKKYVLLLELLISVRDFSKNPILNYIKRDDF